jgi:hypothetical protein
MTACQLELLAAGEAVIGLVPAQFGDELPGGGGVDDGEFRPKHGSQIGQLLNPGSRAEHGVVR